MGIRLIGQYHPDNIGRIVSLTDLAYKVWIFGMYPTDPTVPPK
jgi:hypothetical protein